MRARDTPRDLTKLLDVLDAMLARVQPAALIKLCDEIYGGTKCSHALAHR